MNRRVALSHKSSLSGVYTELLESLPAWLAIFGLILFTAGCILVGVGSLLRLAFPLGSLAVGLFLYFRYPIIYIGFTWWMWFVTPWLRRIIDYRSGWDGQALILVAPFLVTLITLITFVQQLPRAYRLGGLPFVLAFMGVVYGYLIGIIKNPPFVATRALLDWLTPIVFGFHLFVNWQNYPSYRQIIQRTFLWGVLITGTYGVFQYLVAPEWDNFWIIQTEIVTNGKPEPLGIRVFSTMNSALPFANVTLAGLLLLFTSKNPLRIPASIVGYLAFLLSLARSAWGGWLVGMITLVSLLKARFQMRLIITILLMALCVLPLTTIEPFSEIINSRFETFSNIQEDTSFNERSENYQANLNLALSSGLGNGIGSVYFINEKGLLEEVVLDSGVLDILFTLGWFGAIPYLSGIILLVISVFQSSEAGSDPFASAARAISIGLVTQLALGSVMLELTGLVFWGFLGVAMAARKYHLQQRIARVNQS